MKFSFEGEPHELAALLRGLMASTASADVSAVLLPTSDDSTLDGTAAFKRDDLADDPEAQGQINAFENLMQHQEGMERFDSLMQHFVACEPHQRQNAVRFMFASPQVVGAIRAAGGVLELMQTLGFGPPPQDKFTLPDPEEKASIKHVASLVYTLAHMDGLLPEDLRIASLPTMTLTQMREAEGAL